METRPENCGRTLAVVSSDSLGALHSLPAPLGRPGGRGREEGWISFPPASSVNRPARAIASVVSLLENHVAQTLQSLARSTSPFLSGSWIDVHIITVLPQRVKRGRANKPPDIFLTARCNSPPGFADTAIVPTPPPFQSVFAVSPSIFGPLPYPALWLGQQSRFWLPPGVICVSIVNKYSPLATTGPPFGL